LVPRETLGRVRAGEEVERGEEGGVGEVVSQRVFANGRCVGVGAGECGNGKHGDQHHGAELGSQHVVVYAVCSWYLTCRYIRVEHQVFRTRGVFCKSREIGKRIVKISESVPALPKIE
jgi:hypothetical protein